MQHKLSIFAENKQPMKKIGTLLVIAFLVIGCQTEKTAFVDTEELFKEYSEMNDVRERFTKENDEILKDLELKFQPLQIKQQQFLSNSATMSPKKQQERYQELAAEDQKFQQERQARIGKLQADSQAAIDSVITKVKDKVKEYGKTNGYSYIYGSNDAGSVMYGKDELDVTQSVLTYLDEAYKATKE